DRPHGDEGFSRLLRCQGRAAGRRAARRGERRGSRLMIAEDQLVIRELEGLARDRGLVLDPLGFQITDSDEIAQVASMGLPNRFIHWYWGGTYKELVLQQTKEVFSILELVLNTAPSHAFLRSTNSYLQNVLVIAHVFGHADFFTNNHWYRKS